MEVIPAIDLRAGRVVNLVQGDYARETVFAQDPGRVAQDFAGQGAPRIHVVDLDAARGGPPNDAAVGAILVGANGVPVQVGGGIRSADRVEQMLALGIDRIVMGTVALEAPELLREVATKHPGRVILGLDARDGRVAVRGWLETSELSTLQVLARFAGLPLGAVLHTDIRRDGMLGGPNVEATAELARHTRLPVIASGGVSCVEDLLELARTRLIAGCIVGRAIYTGAINLTEAIGKVAAC